MVNLGDIKTSVRANGFESDQDTRVVLFANEVQRDIVNDHRWRFMTVSTTVPAVASINSYALPTSPPLGHIISIRLATTGQEFGEPLEWVETEDLLEAAAQWGTFSLGAMPQRWTDINAETFQVFPGVTLPGTFTIRYLRTAADLVIDADVPNVPSQYLDLIVAGVCARLARRERRLDDVATFQATYDNRLLAMKGQYELRQTQNSRNVSRSGRYTDPYDGC